jgi:hypothetical protein
MQTPVNRLRSLCLKGSNVPRPWRLWPVPGAIARPIIGHAKQRLSSRRLVDLLTLKSTKTAAKSILNWRLRKPAPQLPASRLICSSSSRSANRALNAISDGLHRTHLVVRERDSRKHRICARSMHKTVRGAGCNGLLNPFVLWTLPTRAFRSLGLADVTARVPADAARARPLFVR